MLPRITDNSLYIVPDVNRLLHTGNLPTGQFSRDATCQISSLSVKMSKSQPRTTTEAGLRDQAGPRVLIACDGQCYALTLGDCSRCCCNCQRGLADDFTRTAATSCYQTRSSRH